MINTQTQIDSLIDLAVLQRTELKQLVDSLPQLRDHLSSEIERNLEEIEPAIRSELEQFVAARALDTQAKTSAELSAKLDAMARNLESTTAAKYSVLMAERAQNAALLAQAEARIAEAASALPGAVKGIVTDELARFPRAGEIDQLRKEFAEPRGLNPRGRWQVGETYNKLDLVSYNGDSYVSNTNGNREKPSRSSEAWTLSAARGNGGAGGGVTSLTDLVAVPANGELLIGNGSAFVNNTITGGTGVTVTNGPGTITIDASGAQEILTATVTNAESFAITRGQVVYLFGAVGNRASVKLADNTNDAASSKTFGIVSQASISAGGNGLITCVGQVNQLTLGTYTEGDVLYLDATPGAFTNVKPYAPNHLVYVGMVERANNGNGEMYVRIQNGFEIEELHNVQIITPPLAGSLLMRDATNSLWKANRLTGMANQVTVTNADTSVTLSLPTTIANVNSVTAATSQNLTLAGGSTGASLVLGQGANGNATLALKTSARFNLTAPASNDAYIEYVGNAGTAGTTSVVVGQSGAGLGVIYNRSNSALTFGTNSLERGRFTDTGNLLIGSVTDSSSRLKLVGTDSSGPKTWTASSAALSGGLLDSYQDSGGNGFQRYTDIVSLQDSDGANGGGVIRFVTNSISSDSGTEAMRVTKLQNLLIGTTTDGGQKLQVNGTANFAGTVTATDLRTSQNANSGVVIADRTIAATTSTLYYDNNIFRFYLAGADRLTLSSTGAATFAGAVTVAHAALTLATFQRTGFSGGLGVFADDTGPIIAATDLTDSFRINAGGTTALTISAAGAATFAGNVTVSGVGNNTLGGNILIGSGDWPSTNFGRSADRVTISSNAENSILAVGNMQSGVAANRGGTMYLFARGTTATNDMAGGSIVSKRLNATSGNFASSLEFGVSTASISNPQTRLTITDTTATFAGAVTGSRFIASTSLIAGDFTSTNDLGIVAKTTTATYNPLIAAFLAPNQLTFGVGGYSNVYCGVAQSAYNSGALMFSYAGAGSTSNSFGLGIYGQSPAIRINGTGVVNIPSTTPSTGAGSGALQVAGGIYAGANSYFGGASVVHRNAAALLSVSNYDFIGDYGAASTIGAVIGSNSTSASLRIGVLGTDTTSDPFVNFLTSGANNWSVGVDNSDSDSFKITNTNGVGSSEKLTITTAGAATFAGAVAINNTVAAAAGVASTHKVTMVIGGVTYYLLATNV